MNPSEDAVPGPFPVLANGLRLRACLASRWRLAGEVGIARANEDKTTRLA